MRRYTEVCVAGLFLWTNLFAELNYMKAREPEKVAAPKQDPGQVAAAPETAKRFRDALFAWRMARK